MPDYIDVDALTSPSFYYDGEGHIVVNDTTAYNPFTGLLNLDQIANPTPEPASYSYNIYIGSLDTPDYLWGEEDLMSVNSDTAIDPVGNELTIDTLEFQVYCEDNLLSLTYATPIWCYRGSTFVGKFYLKTVERYGVKFFKISAVSLIGLLEYEPHYGGMYQATPAKSAIEEAILANGLGQGNFLQYNSTRTTGGTVTSVPLALNCLGSSVETSGTQSELGLTFTVYSAPTSPAQPVWLSYIDEYGNLEDAYMAGIAVKKTSSSVGDTGITVYVYCEYGGSNTPIGSFSSKYGEEINVIIRPKTGACFYNSDTSGLGSFNFTPISVNELIPIYSSLGIEYSNGIFDAYMTSTLDYELHSFSIRETGSTIGLLIEFCEDVTSGDMYFRNGKTGYSSRAVGYEPVGDPLPSDSDEFTELYEIVRNILWADGIDNMTISGWVGVGTKRETLHQLLFALNLNMMKSADGNIIINKLPGEVQKTISESEIYESGSSEPVSLTRSIELTEHSYTASGNSVTVFDNSALTTTPTGDYVVVFDNAPIYGEPTASSGLTIVSYNANGAIVRGKGSITAQTYLHSQRVLKQTVSTRPDGGVVSVTDATLVTFINSANVMAKLMAYYGGDTFKIKNSTITDGLMCGRKFEYTDPFGEDDEGYLVEARTTGSAITKTDCTFISGYTPADVGNEFDNYEVLTGTGTFTVPTGVTKLHVVLVGGGTGGSSGFAGANGGANSNFYSASVAQGGNYGANGSGGKIYEVDITSPSASYSYECGEGGEGGATSSYTNANNAGSAGGNTTFGTYSSASGSATGYTNLMNGDTFGLTMPKWNENSGKGGNGGYKTITDHNPTVANVTQTQAEGVFNFLTGMSYSGGQSYPGGAVAGSYTWLGGSGGGAALTQNGKNGNAHKQSVVLNANGGNGADATFTPPKATDYNAKYFGYGGMGGCGGGGGGSAGYDGEELVTFSGGTGGYGGKGGDGGDGCIIVFY